MARIEYVRPATAIPTPNATAATTQAPRRTPAVSGASPIGRRWYDDGIAHHAAAIVLAASLLAGACAGDDEPTAGEARADQARQAAEQAGLPDDVADLLADAAAAVDATYRVVYEVAQPEGGSNVVVVTQRPPDRRVDVTADDGVVDASITTGGRTHQCTKPPDEGWRCEDLGAAADLGGADDAAVEEFTDALTARTGIDALGVSQRTILGVDARCLVASGSTTSTLCIAPTGALLLVERPAGTLRATDYGTDVADDAFALPAR